MVFTLLKKVKIWDNRGRVNNLFTHLTKDIIMWTSPKATEMRFGFEVTMYVMNK
jgi:pyrroloquinoline quinone biosynthesis protein A